MEFQGEKEEDKTQSRTASCPSCGAAMRFSERLMVGETVRCNTCNTDLEVTDPDAPSLIQRVRVEALDPEAP